MAKEIKTKVTEEEADALHVLMAEVMEVGLRECLISGKIDNALLRTVVAYLNNNQITVAPIADKRMSSLSDLVASIRDADLLDD